MSERPARPTRADYAVWRQATTRWADVDVYGHMNNARYFELIDTAVNAHVTEAVGADVRTLPAVGLVAEVSCRFFAEVGYPEPVELGLACERLGTSSVTYRVGLFQGPGDEAAAEGRFVHVYVDPAAPADGGARRVVRPVPEAVRAALAPLTSET
ncbi:acyl-CoA thioesterase [Nocardioides aequoreus]|uniref:acyl-CoA thioesterase n=1 Tax=Nocardioides aequoreus TaxID=397278 RepID=UPI000563439E|nr:acyl-CoA thioesterase [Nocardioides aequoreus]